MAGLQPAPTYAGARIYQVPMMTIEWSLPHDRTMQLSSTLTWLVDAASASPGAEQFLAELGTRLIADDMPLAGGAPTLARAAPDHRPPHLAMAGRRNGEVIEAVGFAPAGLRRRRRVRQAMPAGAGWPGSRAVRCMKTPLARAKARPVLGWIGPRRFTDAEANRLREAARFAAAPLAALSARATLSAALEAYLGRRSAARVLAGPLRREVGETIRAVLLYARFAQLHRAVRDPSLPLPSSPPLGGWFDCIGGAVHAFGGEVLKFIGDGVLAIFPVGDKPREACDAALRAVASAKAGMAHLDTSAARAGAAAAVVRRGAASWRNSVGQCRRGRPAGFHRDRSCGESGQPARRALPAARPNGSDLGRGRR